MAEPTLEEVGLAMEVCGDHAISPQPTPVQVRGDLNHKEVRKRTINERRHPSPGDATQKNELIRMLRSMGGAVLTCPLHYYPHRRTTQSSRL